MRTSLAKEKSGWKTTWKRHKLAITCAIVLIVAAVVPGVVQEAANELAGHAAPQTPLGRQIEPLEYWILRNGGLILNVSLQNVTAGEGSGLGWYALSDIPKGSPYLVIPPSLTMGRSTAPQSRCFPVIVQLRQEFSSVGSANLESIELYVMVHFERFVEGNRSFWEPYLSSVSYLESSMPIYLPAAERALLSSLPQGGLAFSSYFNAVEVLTEAVAGFLEARYPKLYNITTAEDSKQLREGLKWAFCLVHSRALHNQRSGVPPYELVLIPGFDSTNHNNAPGAADELQFSQVGNGISQIRQIASRDRMQGDQLYVTIDTGMAKKCTVDFLLGYGFLPKEESYDCFYFRLKYSPMEGDAVAEANRMQALQSLADDVRPAEDGFLELKFLRSTDVAQRIVNAFSLTVARPFQLMSREAIATATVQLRKQSEARVEANLKHLMRSMKQFFNDFIQGSNISERTFNIVYKLQDRSERYALVVLNKLMAGG